MVDTGFFEAWNVTDLGAIREALEQAVGFWSAAPTLAASPE
jgi:hypothetical protein